MIQHYCKASWEFASFAFWWLIKRYPPCQVWFFYRTFTVISFSSAGKQVQLLTSAFRARCTLLRGLKVLLWNAQVLPCLLKRGKAFHGLQIRRLLYQYRYCNWHVVCIFSRDSFQKSSCYSPKFPHCFFFWGNKLEIKKKLRTAKLAKKKPPQNTKCKLIKA